MSHILLNVRLYFTSQDVADAHATVAFPVVDYAFPLGGTVRAVGPVMHRAAVLPRRVCVYTYNFKSNNNIPKKAFIFISCCTHNYLHFSGRKSPSFRVLKLVTLPGLMAMTNELHPVAATLKRKCIVLVFPAWIFLGALGPAFGPCCSIYNYYSSRCVLSLGVPVLPKYAGNLRAIC